MNPALLYTLAISLFTQVLLAANSPILVTETTISLNVDQTEELFFSFAEGDVIEFDFDMVKGKHLKELEIVELPNTTLFSEFKAQHINKKKITIRNKGVYKFSFYSSSLTRRVFKVRISRTPASEATANFNTNWKWKKVTDTIYKPYTVDSITGYKKVNFTETKRELVKREKVADVLFNKSQRVHSYSNSHKSKTFLKVDLPRLDQTELKEERFIAWAYWISVGQEGQEAYKKNLANIGDFGEQVATTFKTPLVGLAIGTITDLFIPHVGEDVGYYFILDYENAQKFYNDQQFRSFDYGKGKAAYGKNTRITQGTFYIGLKNDNLKDGIDVDVKVVAIKEVSTYEDKTYERVREEPMIVKLHKTRMELKETKFRIPVE